MFSVPLWLSPGLLLLACATVLQAQQSPQEQIQKLLEGTEQLFAVHELDQAESDIRHALGLALDQMGAIYSALGEYEQAEAAYRQAIRAAPASGSSLIGLAILCLRTGQYEKGIEAAEQILKLNPLHPEARHVLGKIRFMQGDFEEAASQLSDAYRVRRDDISISYTLALAYLKLERAEDARKIFDEILQQLGESAQLRLLFGRAYRQVDRPEEALAEFKRAIEIDPQATRAHYYLGLTYLLMQGQSAFDEAIREFEIELESDPQAYFPNFYLGLIYSQQHDNPQAQRYLEKAITADPDNPDPYLYLGQALSQQEDYPAAVQALEKSIQLTQDESRNSFQVANAHYALGRALLRTGEREKALQHLDRSRQLKAQLSEHEASVVDAIQGGGLPMGSDPVADSEDLAPSGQSAILLNPAEPNQQERRILLNTVDSYRKAAAQGYLHLARVFTEQSDFAVAAEALEHALDWDSSTPGAAFNLGLARLKAGQQALAVDPLIQVLQTDPGHLEARRLLAHLALELVESQQREAAQRAVSFLKQANPNVPELHLLSGHLAAQQGHFEEALGNYRRALQIDAATADAHYSQGTVLIRLGRLEEASIEFEEELKLNPRHPRALYHKALILITQRKAEEAIPILEDVIGLQPDYADAYYQLGKAQLQTGSDSLRLLALANLETAAHLNPSASYVFFQLAQAYRGFERMEESRRALERYRSLKKAEEEARLKGMQEPPGG